MRFETEYATGSWKAVSPLFLGAMPPHQLAARPTAGALALLLLAASSVLQGAEDPHPCASIRDDADRLGCYDKAFGSPAATPTGPTGPAGGREFSFSAVVTALERRGDERFLATLDNGQVWLQVETNTRAEVRVGDTVTVRRGALGSYLLSTSAGIGTRVKRLR
jgi:hypothetical protein